MELLGAKSVCLLERLRPLLSFCGLLPRTTATDVSSSFIVFAGFLYASPQAWAILDGSRSDCSPNSSPLPSPQRTAIAAKSASECKRWASAVMKLQMLLLDTESCDLIQTFVKHSEDCVQMFGGLERPACIVAGARLLHDLILSDGDRVLALGFHEMRAPAAQEM
jgi:hypothetical protein